MFLIYIFKTFIAKRVFRNGKTFVCYAYTKIKLQHETIKQYLETQELGPKMLEY